MGAAAPGTPSEPPLDPLPAERGIPTWLNYAKSMAKYDCTCTERLFSAVTSIAAIYKPSAASTSRLLVDGSVVS